jgi:hypothetical protein
LKQVSWQYSYFRCTKYDETWWKSDVQRDLSTDNCHDKKSFRCTKQKENDRKETPSTCVIKCLIEHDGSLSGRRQHGGRMNSIP